MATGPDERKWPDGWDDHRRAQLRRMAALPLSEKIAWLEEAQRLAVSLGARKPTAGPTERDRRTTRNETA